MWCIKFVIIIIIIIIMSEPARINLFFFEDLFFKELGILGIRDFILFNLFSC